jgi:hypothetical protein
MELPLCPLCGVRMVIKATPYSTFAAGCWQDHPSHWMQVTDDVGNCIETIQAPVTGIDCETAADAVQSLLEWMPMHTAYRDSL